VNTALPGDETKQKARLAVEGGGPGGNNNIMQYSYSGPVSDNLKAKIIEIMPRKSGNDFKNISKNLNLTHEQIRIKPKFKSSIPQNGLIICDLNLIKKKLIQFGMKL